MANRYPATPSFGGAFPSLPYPSLLPQQNGHNLFAGRPPVTSPMGASQSTSGGNPQSINASNFADNAQIPSPGLVIPPIPHQFSQDLFKQLVNSSLPPPPPPSFPPVPIPNLGFPAYQPPPTLPNNFTLPQNPNTGNLVGDISNLLEDRTGSQAIFEKPTEPIAGSREEGELSDGELENDSAAGSSQTVPQEEAAKLQVSSPNKAYSTFQIQGPSGSSSRSPPPPSLNPGPGGHNVTSLAEDHRPVPQNRSNYGSDMGNVLRGQRESIPEISSLSRQGSGSSYDPPSVTTPDFVIDHSIARDGMSPQLHGKRPSQIRELAKGALLSLAPHGIRYTDLVKEGVDPDLLQQLYEEIGIKDCRPEPSADSRTYQETHALNQRTVSSGYESDINTSSMYLPDKPAFHLSGIPAAADLKDSPRIQQKVAQSNSAAVEPSKNMETPLRQTESASIVSTKTPVTVAASNVAMERKDRIAQLLAAKTGKSAPIRSTPDVTPTAVQVHTSLASMPPASNPVILGENEIAPNVPQQLIQKSAKNKAQTELVRQKMESLKKEAEAKARAQSQSQTVITPRSNIPAGDTNVALTTPDLDQSPITNLDGSSQQTRQPTSDFSSLTKSSSQPNHVYRIPGLFMTSDEPSDFEEPVHSTLGSQVDQAAVACSELEHGLTQEPRILSARDHSSVTGSLTEINLASLGNQGSTNRLPQKRPLASDSFDEPAPLANRPFGRKDSVEHIEIDVSEDENDDGSDGIGMDIDEDSQTSGLVISSATPSKGTSETNAHLLQSIKPSERPSVQQQTANSSLGISTPTKEKDKEDLWRAKNQEIEAMRKRIAEMEQRRKAKRGQSQAQSPHSSLPGTPATPKVQNASPSQVSLNPGSLLQNIKIGLNQPHGTINVAAKNASNGDHQPLAMSPLSRIATESPSHGSHGEDLRKKIARRKELQDGLPNLDAEVMATQLKLAQTKARLAAIKREAEKREAEIREARQREAEIVAEAMKLEEQLNIGLKGRTRFSEELQSLGADADVVSEVRATFAESLESGDEVSNPSYVPPSTNLPDRSGAQDIRDVAPAAARASIADADSPIVDKLNDETNSEAIEEEELVAADSSNDEPGNFAANITPTVLSVIGNENYKGLNRNLRSQSQTSADPESYQSSIMPQSSDEELASVDDIIEKRSENISGILPGLDNDNDASVSMSDSGTDEYEPAEIPDITQYSDIESEAYEPDDGLPSGKSDQGDAGDIDDDYEPTEEVEPMEVDLRNLQPVSKSDYQNLKSQEPRTADERSPDPYSPGPVDKSATDNIEDGLEVSEVNMLTVPQDFPSETDLAPVKVDGNQAAATHFIAYESPLFFSKNFRFDPNFPALVAGGYSSLTYSNKIDPSRPLCPTEAEGGSCTDPECEEQHFQQMALPDDKILVEMSSARDFRQGDQRDQFLIGLKQVIAELRSKGVKEFPTVASALAAYRRNFMASIDPNRAIPS